MSTQADMAAFVDLSERIDRVEDALDAYSTEIGSEVCEKLARSLRDIAGDVKAASHHFHADTAPPQLALAGLASLSRRRILADRFAGIAADAEADHLRERVRRLESRLADCERRLPIRASMVRL